jgi:hypothetical protein
MLKVRYQYFRQLACLVSAFDGAYLFQSVEGGVWDNFSTGAPQRHRRSIERYNTVKRA